MTKDIVYLVRTGLIAGLGLTYNLVDVSLVTGCATREYRPLVNEEEGLLGR